MSTIELEAYKLELLRDIMNNFNSESSLRKLAAACRLIHNGEQELPKMPTVLLSSLMENAASQDNADEYLTDEELEEEIKRW